MRHLRFLASLLLLAVGAMLYAADPIICKLPTSDLTTKARPYVLTIEVTDPALTGKGTIELTIHRTDSGSKITAPMRMAVDFTLVKAAEDTAAKPRVVTAALNVANLAEGEYAGEATITLGETTIKKPVEFFRMPEGKPRPFPFGVYSVDFGKTAEEQQSVIDAMHNAGINLMSLHMEGMGGMGPIFDRAARYGMEFMPSNNTNGRGIDSDKPEYQIVLRNGEKVNYPYPCFNNPEGRRKAAEAYINIIRDYKTHPAFSDLIYYGDDMGIPAYPKDRSLGIQIGCYCDVCKQGFLAQTGKEAPVIYEAKKGVVPDDDTLVQWMRYRCKDVFAGFVHSMEEAKNTVDPTIRMGLIHGWSGQPYINLTSGQYSPYDQGATQVVSSYAYPEVTWPRADFIANYEIGRMGNRQKDQWMLGEIGTWKNGRPPFVVRQNFWNMLAAGNKFISWFSWSDLTIGIKMGLMKQSDMDITVNALTECARTKDWLLPVAAYWQEPDMRDALLYSFTTESFDVLPPNKGRAYMANLTAVYREALRQHVPMGFISEEEIQAGMLKNVDSLSLFGATALPESVFKAIEQFAAAGGTVYYPDDSPVKVKGGQQVNAQTAVTFIGNRNDMPVSLDNPDIAFREFYSGDARYYVFINNYCDRYWGMRRSGSDNKLLNESLALIKDLPAASTVHFRKGGLNLFDLETGSPVGNTNAPFDLKLAPSWGKILVALPAKEARLKVQGSRTLQAGETANFKLEMLDEKGKLVPAAFAIQVKVMAPSGRESRYSCAIGLKDGAGEFSLPVGVNDETGKWQIAFTGGFPRKTTTQTLEVKAGKLPAGLLTIQP